MYQAPESNANFLAESVFARARNTALSTADDPPSFPPPLKRGLEQAESSLSERLAVNPAPAAPQRLRLAPSPRVATAVATVLVLAALGIVAWQMFLAPASPAPLKEESPGDAPGAALTASTSERNAHTPPELFQPGANGDEVVVYVTGAVSRPGVVHLANPSRVTNALEAARGASANADLSALNLARVLVDGEQIHVPLPGEAPPAQTAASGETASQLVNLNTADSDALQKLSGIGPALAKRILDYRKSVGRFQSVDQLDEVSGIGPSLLERLRDQVTV